MVSQLQPRDLSVIVVGALMCWAGYAAQGRRTTLWRPGGPAGDVSCRRARLNRIPAATDLPNGRLHLRH